MAKASGGKTYSPLSARERKPLSHKLFTNLLAQALGRQGVDPSLAPAIVQDLMAQRPPGTNVPEQFDIHGVQLAWPQGREARVLYPQELQDLNRALARNGNPVIRDEDGIVRYARDVYETLWRKRNAPDYVCNAGGYKPPTPEPDMSAILTDAIVESPLDITEHEHVWVRSPGDAQDCCSVAGCGATQQAPHSAVAGLVRTDARPNPEPEPELLGFLDDNGTVTEVVAVVEVPVIEHVLPTTPTISSALAALTDALASLEASK